jgi:membrane protein implicated in regulation of membrane protease activity
MHLVALAWIYVVVLMGVVEALSPNGTVLGAVFTVLLYGVLPLSVVLYIVGTPMRRRNRRRRQPSAAVGSVAQEDGRGQATGDIVSTVREEP